MCLSSTIPKIYVIQGFKVFLTSKKLTLEFDVSNAHLTKSGSYMFVYITIAIEMFGVQNLARQQLLAQSRLRGSGVT